MSDRNEERPGSRPSAGDALNSTHFVRATASGEDRASLSALRQIVGQRPVDLLVRRLEARDGHRWFVAGLSEELMASTAPSLLDGSADVEGLIELRRQAKGQYSRANDRRGSEQRMRGLCAYFLAIAASLRHHGELRSSLPWVEVRDALLELSTVLPEPWSALIEGAVDRGDEGQGGREEGTREGQP